MTQILARHSSTVRLQRDSVAFMCCNKSLTQPKEESMNLSSHLQELKRKHQSLSHAVEQMQRSPGVDDLSVAELKKQKLRIKEQITRLSTQPG